MMQHLTSPIAKDNTRLSPDSDSQMISKRVLSPSNLNLRLEETFNTRHNTVIPMISLSVHDNEPSAGDNDSLEVSSSANNDNALHYTSEDDAIDFDKSTDKTPLINGFEQTDNSKKVTSEETRLTKISTEDIVKVIVRTSSVEIMSNSNRYSNEVSEETMM